jgi:hypothetical protein
MSPPSDPNPKGKFNNLEIFPSWAHFQQKFPNQLSLELGQLHYSKQNSFPNC